MTTTLIKCFNTSTGEVEWLASIQDVLKRCSAGRDIHIRKNLLSARAQVSAILNDNSNKMRYNGWRLFKVEIDIGNLMTQLDYWNSEALRYKQLYFEKQA